MFWKSAHTVIAIACVAGLGAGVFTAGHMASAAALDFPYEKDIGGGERSQLLIENNRLRVTLVFFKKGTTRPGNLKRRSDQLIIYLDQGHLKQLPVPGRPPQDNFQDPLNCNTPIGCGPVGNDGKRANAVPSGSTAYRPKDSIAQTLEVTDDYRALYVEFK